MLIAQSKSVLSMTLAATFLVLACSNSGAQAEKSRLRNKYEQTKSQKQALVYARYLLNNSADSVDGIEKEWAEIKSLETHFKHPELTGINGAYRAKMGDVYQDVDLIKAVECVDEGLDILQKALKKSPKQKMVRLYYGVTLASLPALFKKQAEAKSVLDELASTYTLTQTERSTVEMALKQIP
ncbi:MAG: hypothetical protein HOK97_17440 [Deltaproteobacteria bacterium]|jgi:hypothetical protein|nr:hypothetical protein [Deltaproteobacteria bacterium]MBT6491558.1 hypothetical protein [Deltaproteobacteria bacterium]